MAASLLPGSVASQRSDLGSGGAEAFLRSHMRPQAAAASQRTQVGSGSAVTSQNRPGQCIGLVQCPSVAASFQHSREGPSPRLWFPGVPSGAELGATSSSHTGRLLFCARERTNEGERALCPESGRSVRTVRDGRLTCAHCLSHRIHHSQVFDRVGHVPHRHARGTFPQQLPRALRLGAHQSVTCRAGGGPVEGADSAPGAPLGGQEEVASTQAQASAGTSGSANVGTGNLTASVAAGVGTGMAATTVSNGGARATLNTNSASGATAAGVGSSGTENPMQAAPTSSSSSGVPRGNTAAGGQGRGKKDGWWGRLVALAARVPDLRPLAFVGVHMGVLVLASRSLGADGLTRGLGFATAPAVRIQAADTAIAPTASSPAAAPKSIPGSGSSTSSSTSAGAAAAAAAALAGSDATASTQASPARLRDAVPVGAGRGSSGGSNVEAQVRARQPPGARPIAWLGRSNSEGRPWQLATNLVVPFSEFLYHVRRGNVGRVSVDGARVTFVVRRVDLVQHAHRAAALLPQVLSMQEMIRSDDRAMREVAASVQRGAGGVPKGWPYPSRGSSGMSKLPPSKGSQIAGEFPMLGLQLQLATVRSADMAMPYEELLAKNVEFGAPEKRPVKLDMRTSIDVMLGLLHAGILAAVLVNIIGITKLGRSQKSRKGARGPGVLFADVAGVDEAKEELQEIVEYLRTPERFRRLGARPPRGVLLVGPPGTGKTMLAKAVAGEANVPFMSCSGSEFVELYVGLGAMRVRDLFAKAKKDAPAIVFIDEIDSVARVRDGRTRGMGNDEREQTLNQLLTEMDGFDSNTAVIVIAATNRADVIDPALRRPGRFDRIVAVEAPDRKGRSAILQVHLEKQRLPLADDVDVHHVATATSGFTGAELANVVNEAALLAAREESCSAVARIHFDKAVERAIAGIEKKRSALGASEKAVVARHEVGHAILGAAVAKILPNHARVQKISIIPRSGGALGFAYIPPAPEGEERQLLFVDELRGQLAVLLGGRAAEEVAYRGRVSTGAMDDIRRATGLAYKAFAEYGLSSKVGPLSLSTLSGDELGFPDQGRLAEQVQKEVQELLQEALGVARLVVQRNRQLLEDMGNQLQEDESVEGKGLKSWLDQVDCTEELRHFIQQAALIPGTERKQALLPKARNQGDESNHP